MNRTFFRSSFQHWRIKQTRLCRLNAVMFQFPSFPWPLLVVISTRESLGSGGPSCRPNLATLGSSASPADLLSISCLHLPTRINYTYCSFLLIFLKIIRTHWFKKPNNTLWAESKAQQSPDYPSLHQPQTQLHFLEAAALMSWRCCFCVHFHPSLLASDCSSLATRFEMFPAGFPGRQWWPASGCLLLPQTPSGYGMHIFIK